MRSSLEERCEQWKAGQPALGRLPAEDPDDNFFPMRASIDRRRQAPDPDTEAALERGWRYWNAEGWWGDQGGTPHCVAFSWTHYLEDGPVTVSDTPHGLVGGDPVLYTTEFYNTCQTNDEWPGTDYDGTSVRAGAKVLQRRGLIGEYRWARSVEEIAEGIITVSPVIVGTDWTMDMFLVNDKGFISVGGDPAGGHAYILNGVNTGEEKFRLKNSWGRKWGQGGHAWISFEDMELLMDNYGEACIAEQSPTAKVTA